MCCYIFILRVNECVTGSDWLGWMREWVSGRSIDWACEWVKWQKTNNGFSHVGGETQRPCGCDRCVLIPWWKTECSLGDSAVFDGSFTKEKKTIWNQIMVIRQRGLLWTTCLSQPSLAAVCSCCWRSWSVCFGSCLVISQPVTHHHHHHHHHSLHRLICSL